MRIQRFEDIEAWKAARKLTRQVYSMSTRELFAKDFGLAGQMQRATVSVMSNIAEGFDSGSKLEFIRFLGYARRSASEVQSHLDVALDQEYIDQQEFSSVYEQAASTRKLISAFVRYLRGFSNHGVDSRQTRAPVNRPTGKPANRLT